MGDRDAASAATRAPNGVGAHRRSFFLGQQSQQKPTISVMFQGLTEMAATSNRIAIARQIGMSNIWNMPSTVRPACDNNAA